MTVYDLSQESRSVSMPMRAARVVWGSFTVVFLAIAVGMGLETISLVSRGPLTALQVLIITVVETGMVAGIAICMVGIQKTGPGARTLSVDERGIELEWPKGRREILTWEHPVRPYVLLDFSEGRKAPPQFGTLWELRIRNRTPTRLSEEAFLGIIAKARSLGLRVETEVMANPAFWLPCRATRIVPR